MSLASHDEAGSSIRALAFYLPQFHPIPENDRWWGRGFTEWTNVARARPLFPGHHQPHLPGELGFYDLRLPQVQEAQADLARAHLIHGFCYYHYWFNGTRLLNRPLDNLLASGTPDFPFCLCWANENWTRVWDGREEEVLIGQAYSTDDDLRHIRWLAEVFSDPRYIRVAGKPLFLVYRSSRIPDPLRTTENWRSEAIRLGIGELYLCRVDSFHEERIQSPIAQGFDAAVDFQPDWTRIGPSLRRNLPWRLLARSGISNPAFVEHRVLPYSALAERMMARPQPGYRRFPCVTPSWDNSARRRTGALILSESSPDLYAEWLRRELDRFVPFGPGEDLFFINAWNEWGEGNHLEPCQRWGRGYLEATRDLIAARRFEQSPACVG